MKHRESEKTQLRVSRLLNRDSVMLHAEMPSVQTALETLVELQESNGVITNGIAYYKAVCERERAGGTTAIGEGLAIPHACNAGVASLGLAADVIKTLADMHQTLVADRSHRSAGIPAKPRR